MKGYIDLHVHTKCSDGRYTYEEVIRKSKENGVKYLAFADHYNMSAYEILYNKKFNDIEIIPGLEIGTSLEPMGYMGKSHRCHMAIYYPSPKIYLLLDRYEKDRKKCVKFILENLRKKGIDLTYSKLLELASNPDNVGRFDVAVALFKLGYAESPTQAYGMYLDCISSAYVNRNKPTPLQIIKFVKKTGGVSVIVHPKSLGMSRDTEYNFFKKLARAGLDGIEVYNPNNNQERRKWYLSMCNEFNLISTVGSDYHGLETSSIEIGLGINGNLKISDVGIINQIKERANINV